MSKYADTASRINSSWRDYLVARLLYNWPLLLILGAVLGLGTIYSLVTPLFEASDESRHYPVVKHIADGRGLPVQKPGTAQPWRQEGSQPPLYYVLMAAATSWVDTDGMAQVLWRNPHADIGFIGVGNRNMVIHTTREHFPYRGTSLAVHVIRLLGVMLAAGTVLWTYWTALEIFPAQRSLATGAAALTAFNPMFLFISGSVNNDSLVVFLSTLAVWLMVRLIRVDVTLSRLIILGLITGLGILSKLSALGLIPLAFLALALASLKSRNHKSQSTILIARSIILNGMLVMATALAVAGWWFYRNWRLYQDPLGLKTMLAIAGTRHPVPTLWQLRGERTGFLMAFWGFFGGMNVPAEPWFYDLFNTLALLGGLGLVVYVARWLRRRPRYEVAVSLLLLSAWIGITLGALLRWTTLTPASQGRLLFPALSAISILLFLGLAQWVPTRFRPVLTTFVGCAMFVIAVLVPFRYIAPAYARPPLLSAAETAAIPHPLVVDFGDQACTEPCPSMQLLGYGLGEDIVRAGQDMRVTLYWKALAPMERNYSVFVHLLSDNDLILGQRDTYPGQGSYPTSLLTAGDIIRDDYIFQVSPMILSASQATVEVGLYVFETGERLLARHPDGTPLGDNVRFGSIRVEHAVGPDGIPNPVFFNMDDKIALVGVEVDRTAVRPGESFHLTLYWKALAEMQKDYTVFTQLLDEQARIWAQQDSQPQKGQAPTSRWKKGQVVKDEYTLRVKDETPAGVYGLDIGLYLLATGQRLARLDEAGQASGNHIRLGTLRVVRP